MSLPLVVCLDNVRSAYNVGSVFRTADSAGVREILLCGYTPFPPNPKLQKTALGSLDTVPWSHHCQVEKALSHYQQLGYEIVVSEVTPYATSLYESGFTHPTVLVFGNEVSGVQASCLAKANRVIKIPHFGVKESLNIATAAGVVIYEFRRQHLNNMR